ELSAKKNRPDAGRIEHIVVSEDPMWERACSGRRSDDDCSTYNIDVDCSTAIASKLAPTLVLGVLQNA
ncbi:MAG: hypothetical protein ACRER3_28265, partial [Pseudomonas fluorescens]